MAIAIVWLRITVSRVFTFHDYSMILGRKTSISRRKAVVGAWPPGIASRLPLFRLAPATRCFHSPFLLQHTHTIVWFLSAALLFSRQIPSLELASPVSSPRCRPAISRHGHPPRMATQIDPMDLGEDEERHDQPDETHHVQDQLEDRPSDSPSPSLQVCERKEIAREFLPFGRPHDASGISRPRPVVPSQIDRLQTLQIGADGFNANMLVSRSHRQPLPSLHPEPAFGQPIVQPLNHASGPLSTVEPSQVEPPKQEVTTAVNAMHPDNTTVVHEGDSQGSLGSLSERPI